MNNNDSLDLTKLIDPAVLEEIKRQIQSGQLPSLPSPRLDQNGLTDKPVVAEAPSPPPPPSLEQQLKEQIQKSPNIINVAKRLRKEQIAKYKEWYEERLQLLKSFKDSTDTLDMNQKMEGFDKEIITKTMGLQEEQSLELYNAGLASIRLHPRNIDTTKYNCEIIRLVIINFL